jgi:hypothetical protein
VAAEGLKGCAARTGQPAAALDPLTRTPRWAVMPFRTRVFAAGGCHLYFARRVTFLSCADTLLIVRRLWEFVTALIGGIGVVGSDGAHAHDTHTPNHR